jgi:hypothetical protein
MSDTPYKQEAENWAAHWGRYTVLSNHLPDCSSVEVWRGGRKITAWFDEDGQECFKTDVFKGGALGDGDRQANIKDLKEWLDNG